MSSPFDVESFMSSHNIQKTVPEIVNNLNTTFTIKIGKSGIPTLIYKVVKQPKGNKYYLEPTLPRWSLPHKIYGDLRDKAVIIWNNYAKLYNKGGGSSGAMLTGDSGAGKALHGDTLVRVTNGWKPIKDIKINDKVIGKNGLPAKVVGVFPQGKVPLYRITFEDGRSTRPCGDHLWEIIQDGVKDVYNTKELILRMDKHPDSIFSIPLCDAVLNTPFTIPYEPDDYTKRVNNYLEERIRKCYLDNTADVREKLLRCLLKDSVSEEKPFFHYECTNEFIVKDIVMLARSLGYIAKEYATTDTKSIPLFGVRVEGEKRTLQISCIEPIEAAEAYCISVNNADHLYVVEDYIVTHNTETCKILCNIAIDNNMPVIEVSNLEATMELVQFLSGLNDVVIFLDEFVKNFASLQDTMLTALSDLYKTNKLFIITENDSRRINQYILNSPSRIKHHYRFKRIGKDVLEEYSTDMKVREDFLKDLLLKYDRSPVFSFNHLRAIVEEHVEYPNDSLDDLIGRLNVSVLDNTTALKVTKVYDTVAKEELKFDSCIIDIPYFNKGYSQAIKVANNVYKFSKNDIITTYDDGDRILLGIENLVITLDLIKETGGSTSRW